MREHRENVRTALVDAAESIVRTEGVDGLTAGAVTKAAGIACNSIYRYVDSVDDLRGLADTLRIDEAATGVRVSTVAPGPTNSGMLRAMQAAAGAGFEPDHYLDPATIARTVRHVVDAPPDAQLTDVAVRPRVELHLR